MSLYTGRSQVMQHAPDATAVQPGDERDMLTALPVEVRERIYRHLLHMDNCTTRLVRISGFLQPRLQYKLPGVCIMAVNKHIAAETKKYFRERNTFVAIALRGEDYLPSLPSDEPRLYGLDFALLPAVYARQSTEHTSSTFGHGLEQVGCRLCRALYEDIAVQCHARLNIDIGGSDGRGTTDGAGSIFTSRHWSTLFVVPLQSLGAYVTSLVTHLAPWVLNRHQHNWTLLPTHVNTDVAVFATEAVRHICLGMPGDLPPHPLLERLCGPPSLESEKRRLIGAMAEVARRLQIPDTDYVCLISVPGYPPTSDRLEGPDPPYRQAMTRDGSNPFWVFEWLLARSRDVLFMAIDITRSGLHRFQFAALLNLWRRSASLSAEAIHLLAHMRRVASPGTIDQAFDWSDRWTAAMEVCAASIMNFASILLAQPYHVAQKYHQATTRPQMCGCWYKHLPDINGNTTSAPQWPVAVLTRMTMLDMLLHVLDDASATAYYVRMNDDRNVQEVRSRYAFATAKQELGAVQANGESDLPQWMMERAKADHSVLSVLGQVDPSDMWDHLSIRTEAIPIVGLSLDVEAWVGGRALALPHAVGFVNRVDPPGGSEEGSEPEKA